MVFGALGVFSATSSLRPIAFHPLPLEENQVEVEVESCGVCHSDLSSCSNEWGTSKYPLVPGHEIIGKITKVGKKVKKLMVGQRVGVGPQTGSCGKCQFCLSGNEPWCREFQACYNGKTGSKTGLPRTFGGFAEKAPFLCAGITTWAPLQKVPPLSNVGILGLGGLGHMGVQFAVKMGHSVTVFSNSPHKRAEAEQWGARFVLASSKMDMRIHRQKFDFLLSTISSSNANWLGYLLLLKKGGTFCTVGIPPKLGLPVGVVVGHGLIVTGSNLCGRDEIDTMFAFAAKHNIEPMVEILPFSQEGAQEAMQRVQQNKMKYRVVLDRSNLRSKL